MHNSALSTENTRLNRLLPCMIFVFALSYPPKVSTALKISTCIIANPENTYVLINPLWGHCQEYKSEKKAILQERFYQKKEALLLITTLPCVKVFVSLITKNKSKSSWHTEKFAKSRLKEKSSGRMRTSAKTAKSVPSCVASKVLQVTDKLPSFPRKAEFSQIER